MKTKEQILEEKIGSTFSRIKELPLNDVLTITEVLEVMEEYLNQFTTFYYKDKIETINRTQPKWIIAEKEVPNEGERVLGYSDDYEKTEIVVFKDERFMMINNDGELESFEFSDCVTHWQPIPTNPL